MAIKITPRELINVEIAAVVNDYTDRTLSCRAEHSVSRLVEMERETTTAVSCAIR